MSVVVEQSWFSTATAFNVVIPDPLPPNPMLVIFMFGLSQRDSSSGSMTNATLDGQASDLIVSSGVIGYSVYPPKMRMVTRSWHGSKIVAGATQAISTFSGGADYYRNYVALMSGAKQAVPTNYVTVTGTGITVPNVKAGSIALVAMVEDNQNATSGASLTVGINLQGPHYLDEGLNTRDSDYGMAYNVGTGNVTVDWNRNDWPNKTNGVEIEAAPAGGNQVIRLFYELKNKWEEKKGLLLPQNMGDISIPDGVAI